MIRTSRAGPIALVAAAIALAGCARSEQAATQVKAVAQAATAAPTVTSQDAAFMDTAGRLGIEAVTFGQLARTQAGQAAVRDYGLRMIDEQTRRNQALSRLAGHKDVDPTVSMDTAHQNAFDALQAVHGRAFDRAYLDGQVADREAALAAYRDEAAHGTDPSVRTFAAQGVTALEAQLRLAQHLGGHAPPPVQQ
jgi:putative membrane protein